MLFTQLFCPQLLPFLVVSAYFVLVVWCTSICRQVHRRGGDGALGHRRTRWGWRDPTLRAVRVLTRHGQQQRQPAQVLGGESQNYDQQRGKYEEQLVTYVAYIPTLTCVISSGLSTVRNYYNWGVSFLPHTEKLTWVAEFMTILYPTTCRFFVNIGGCREGLSGTG